MSEILEKLKILQVSKYISVAGHGFLLYGGAKEEKQKRRKPLRSKQKINRKAIRNKTNQKTKVGMLKWGHMPPVHPPPTQL